MDNIAGRPSVITTPPKKKTQEPAIDPIFMDLASGGGATGQQEQPVDTTFLRLAQEAPPPRTAGMPAEGEPLSAQQHLAGMSGTFANAVLFGKLPQLYGKVKGSDEMAQRLGAYLAEYQTRAKVPAKIAEVAGEVVPYFAGIGTALRAATVPQKVSAAYGAARRIPALGRLLPASGATAAEIAAIEGTRGAVMAPEDESRVAAALERAAMALPFGRFGEVVGTAMAARTGPTRGALATQAEEATKAAGQAYGAFESQPLITMTPELRSVISGSKILREKIAEIARNQGLNIRDPRALQQAYSEIAAEVAGTPKSANIYRDVLNPFREAIDKAAAVPLTPITRQYAQRKAVEEAGDIGEAGARYIRSGAGNAAKASPEAMIRAGRAGSQAERDQMAQALLATLTGRAEPTFQSTMFGTARNMAGALGRYGTASDVIAQMGGRLRPMQEFTVQTGRGLGASQGPTTRR